jgi:hypothetical protein
MGNIQAVQRPTQLKLPSQQCARAHPYRQQKQSPAPHLCLLFTITAVTFGCWHPPHPVYLHRQRTWQAECHQEQVASAVHCHRGMPMQVSCSTATCQGCNTHSIIWHAGIKAGHAILGFGAQHNVLCAQHCLTSFGGMRMLLMVDLKSHNSDRPCTWQTQESDKAETDIHS